MKEHGVNRWLGSVLLGGAVLCAPASGWAEPQVQLAYRVGDGAEECPGELELRAAVEGRLERDPFHPEAARTVRASVQREGEALVGRIELIDARGLLEGVREHRSALGDCRELTRAMALSISIAVDSARERADGSESLEGGGEPEDGPNPDSEQQGPLPVADGEIDEDGDAAEGGRWRFALGLGVHGSVGALPSFAPGVAIGGAARLERVSLGLEVRGDLAGPVAAEEGGEVASRLLLLSALPCLHFDPLSFCGVASVGTLQASGRGVTQPGQDAAFYAAAGLRGGVSLPLSEGISLRGHVDALGTLTRLRIELGQREVWQAPLGSVTAGLGVLVHFP